jgi:hypothetical protein
LEADYADQALVACFKAPKSGDISGTESHRDRRDEQQT